MTVVFALVCILLIAGGLIFSVLPPLPGPILSYCAILIGHFFVEDVSYATSSLVIWAIIVIAVSIIDFILPIAATKKFGGTKWGIYGGMIGLLLGILLPIPFGIVLGPLLGAIIGDLYGGNRFQAAFKSGFGSFVGFVVGTSLKVLVTLIIGIGLSIKLGSVGIQYIQQLFGS